MTQPKNNIKKFAYKPFARIFHEMADLYRIFQSNEKMQPTLGIALISASARLLEGIANTIIWILPGHEEFKKDIERLKTINKFELLLILRRGIALDRSNNLVGEMAGLVSDRNEIMHPKPSETTINIESVDQLTNSFFFKPNESKGYPYMPTEDDVKNTLVKVFSFLDKYFLEWCKCDKEFLKTIIFDQIVFEDGRRGIMQQSHLIRDKEILEAGLGIKIKFIDTDVLMKCLLPISGYLKFESSMPQKPVV